jgi:2-polyprenyl-3-methyl-5-hydroxy-6-metoxy-1,4-benzoquinol methylase
MEEIQLEWEEVKCAWCGSEQFDICFEGPDRLERLPGNFRLVRCQQCGLYRQNPRLVWASLQRYYPADYVAYDYRNPEKEWSWKKYIGNYGNIKRRRAIERYLKGGRLLEVGCGTGAFLAELLKSGNWDVSGIEPNERAAAHARQRMNVSIYQNKFNEVGLKSETFDAIVLWTVLEHLDNPIQDLQYAYELLKKDGWLVFSVPNVESLDLKIFNRYWAGWDLPRHLYVFPRSTLHEILEHIGFSIVDHECLSASYYAFGHDLDFWSQQWEHRYPMLKRISHAFYYSWFMRMGLLLPLALLDRLKLSSTITVFAQKK